MRDLILFGDCKENLSAFLPNTARTCVTSPPYYGLRNYGDEEKQIGQENTPEEYIQNLVEVFREVREVLTDDGTLWVNIGDSYYNYRPGKAYVKQTVASTNQDLPEYSPKRSRKLDGIKEKDIIGIPWMLAFALRADGWYLRQDIIWHKPNPMPESVKDRCTKSHEYIFLLSKKQNYYFNVDAIKEPTRRKRSVWNIQKKPYRGAHFAVYPPELIEPCILAGSEEGDCVVDPFMGSGTTAMVAKALGRDYIGCELHEDYGNLIRKRMGEYKPVYKVSQEPTVNILDLI